MNKKITVTRKGKDEDRPEKYFSDFTVRIDSSLLRKQGIRNPEYVLRLFAEKHKFKKKKRQDGTMIIWATMGIEVDWIK